MANFDPNNLRPEEIASGFDAEGQFFMLDQLDEYPGKLPDFGVSFEKVESIDDKNAISSEKEEVLNELQEQPSDNINADGSVWDVFSEDEQKPEKAEENEYLLIDELEKSSSIDEPKEESPFEEEISPEMHEELKGIISQDLENVKLRREKKALKEQEESIQDTEIPPDFVIGKEEYFDLTSIEADRPSKYHIQPEPEETVNIIEEQGKKKKEKKQKLPKPPKVKKVREPKIKQPLSRKRKIINYIAAITLLHLLLASYLYIFQKPTVYKVLGLTKDSTVAKDSSISKHKDSKHIDKPKTEAPKKEEHEKVVEKHEPAKSNTEHKEEHKEKRTESKEIIKPVKPIEIIIQNKDSEKHKEQTIKKKTKAPEKSSKNDEEKEFTIQLYATPYIGDAEEWLNFLKGKGIEGYISEQKIRNQVWFRVRYGKFKNYEDAKMSALKYGLNQSRIDRIK